MKNFKNLLLFLVLILWFFSGWPPIWPLGKLGINTFRIPPKIQEVRAAQQVTTVEIWASSINGWTWNTISGCAGISFTQGFDGADGNPAGSVFNDITNKKNGTCEGYFSKTFTWEALGIPAGNTVTQVDGKFDYSHPVETHASVQSIGLMIYDSANSVNITSPDADLETVFDPGAPSSLWSTRDVDGAKDIDSGQQASTTTITVRAYILTASGNNNGADSRNLMDNIIFTITHSTPPVVSVSVSDGVVTYGIMPENTSKTTLSGELNDIQTATNDGNVTETFNIKGQDASGGGCTWTLAATNGSDQYVHQFCNATDNSCTSPPTNYTALTTSYQTLKTGVAVSGTVDFHLRLTTPNPSSCYNQQSIDITVQAAQ